jgi:hypothetical protein
MRRATDYRCVFLGRLADEMHHVTGRDADGVYLDPALVVPLVRRQHVVEHTGWRVVEVDEGADRCPNFLRLTRTGLHLVRLGQHHGEGAVLLPAPFIRELGMMLQRVATDVGRAGR